MGNTRGRLFCWRPTKETLVGFVAGLVVIALSAAMIPAQGSPRLSIAIRDIGQMLLAGVLFPLAYIRRRGGTLSDFGLSFKRWYLLLPINIALGGALLALFLSKAPPPSGFRPDWWKAAFIMCAGIFETLFFYAFLRTLFEKAFGAVPAIILAALFYAFHHVGFQPEYGKLVFVGLMYATAFRLGNSALMIYPFFWGIGGSYDVLIQSQAVSPILHAEPRTLYLGFLMIGALVFAAAREWTPRDRRVGYGLLASLFLTMLNREAASRISKSEQIMEVLRVGEGWTVADLGAGGGLFTLRFAGKVGPGGKVYAVDKRPDYLEFVRRQAEGCGLANIAYVPAAGGRLDLPEATLDLVFVRNVFHHLPRPADYMASLRTYLKQGGRIAVIEHKPKGGLTFVALFKHTTSSDVVSRDMEEAGYFLSESFDFLQGQSFQLFAATRGADRTPDCRP